MTTQIVKIDASLYKDSDCKRRVDFILQGLPKMDESKAYKADYGNAFHRFIACRRKGLDVKESIAFAVEYYLDSEVPDKDFRDPKHLADTCLGYEKHYQVDPFTPLKNEKGEVSVELPFALPFQRITSPSGNIFEYLLCGTIDALGSYGMLPFVYSDIKTTALKQHPKTILRGYQLNSQMLTYGVALRRLFPGRKIPYFIDGVFISTSGAVFDRSVIITPTEEQLNLQEHALLKMCQAHADGNVEPNYNCCETKFGLCAFFDLCLMSTSMRNEKINTLTKTPYDPLRFQVD